MRLCAILLLNVAHNHLMLCALIKRYGGRIQCDYGGCSPPSAHSMTTAARHCPPAYTRERMRTNDFKHLDVVHVYWRSYRGTERFTLPHRVHHHVVVKTRWRCHSARALGIQGASTTLPSGGRLLSLYGVPSAPGGTRALVRSHASTGHL